MTFSFKPSELSISFENVVVEKFWLHNESTSV